MQDQADTRIIGRSDAIKDCFSYAVILTDMMAMCGGSLFAREVVLTMAHCSLNLTQMSALFGIHVLNNLDGEVFAYNETLIINDIMLIFLEDVSTANNIITVKLNFSPSVPSMG